MNLERVEQIAKAVLYEGYMLYPYRPSSVKNRQRWNFGVVYPRAYSEAQGGQDACSMKTECLVQGDAATVLEVRLRFLHLRIRSPREPEQNVTQSSTQTSEQSPEQSSKISSAHGPSNGWQEAVEREVTLEEVTLGKLCAAKETHAFTFPAEMQADEKHLWRQEGVEGSVEVSAQRVRDDVFKVSIQVRNTTPMEAEDAAASRNAALMHSLVSTHVVLGVQDGAFVSLLEPPADLQELAAQCENIGVWPVLVGDAGQRDTLLASPIILYDYPQIAPESVGDLFDGTEIDEILSLRIMTLTDDEKREMRDSDERARQILERTESMPAEQFMKLHGVVRGMRQLKEDSR